MVAQVAHVHLWAETSVGLGLRVVRWPPNLPIDNNTPIENSTAPGSLIMKIRSTRLARLAAGAGALALAATAGTFALTTDSASAAGACSSIGERGGAEAFSCGIWMENTPVYDEPGGQVVDHLREAGTANWFHCRTEGPVSNDQGYSSSSWARTVGDGGKTGYVPANYFAGSANVWEGLPECNGDDEAPEDPPPSGDFEYPFHGKFHLPFAGGTSTVITQGPGGSFSHYNENNLHAIDLGLAHGTPLLATGPGKIVVASDRGDGYGSTVYIDHGDNRCTQMAHMSQIDVQVGQEVVTGDRVGLVGSTGQSTGAHLHWNIVACNGYLSLETPDTVEQGTNYPEQAQITSQNPGH